MGETVFRGHFRHTIDPKGRLSIPAKFRDVLREGGSDRLVMAPNGTSLDVYPEDKWRELEDKVSTLAKLDPDRRRFQHVYLSAGLDVVLDPHGRIQILQDYRRARRPCQERGDHRHDGSLRDLGRRPLVAL